MGTRAAIAVVLVLGLAADASAAAVHRASVSSTGAQGASTSTCGGGRSISGNGRRVAFVTSAGTLVPGDTNLVADVFVRDLDLGTTSRVSVASDGTQATAGSFRPTFSADGRWVAFDTVAASLVPGDSNGASDVFVHDLDLGTTSRVSVGSGGVEGTGNSFFAALSADGAVVAFSSMAANLVPGDTNLREDVFVHDRPTGETTRVSVGSGGAQGNQASARPAISGDGMVVAFDSASSTLVAGDTNGFGDVFVHDRATGTTTRVSVASDGTQGNGNSQRAILSADGRWVAFESTASTLVPGDTNGVADVFLHDRATGTTTRVSVDALGGQANGASLLPSLSADGRLVAFESVASNLVSGDTNGRADGFVHDRETGVTRRISMSGATQANGDSTGIALALDVAAVAFDSLATNFVAGDTNGVRDVFVLSPTCGDHVLDLGEACDDGNVVDGDGCDANCTPSGCGNGVVSAGEACDDGNAVDGDGCDANCTPTGCGNGVVTDGETCDDANGDDGDGCGAGCGLTLCANGMRIENAVLSVRDLGATAGNEDLYLRGQLVVPDGMALPGPMAAGAQLLVEDLGAGGRALLALTYVTAPIPPAGRGCDALRDGWRAMPGLRMQVYRNRSNAIDPPRCTPQSASGLKTFEVREWRRPRKPRTIEFRAFVRETTIARPVGPLRATVVLGGTAAATLAGHCGRVDFPTAACRSDRAGNSLVCR